MIATLRRSRWAILLIMPLYLLLAACDQEGPMEQAGETVDDAAENAGEAAEDATER